MMANHHDAYDGTYIKEITEKELIVEDVVFRELKTTVKIEGHDDQPHILELEVTRKIGDQTILLKEIFAYDGSLSWKIIGATNLNLGTRDDAIEFEQKWDREWNPDQAEILWSHVVNLSHVTILDQRPPQN